MSGLDQPQIGGQMASAPLSIVQNGSENKFEPSWATWDMFWEMYPKRCARKDAEKAWARMSTSDREAALEALVAWRRVWVARGEMQYVPYPATWLNGERWTDELPTVNTGPRPAAQAPAKLAEVGEKTEMPEKVRLALAKMRGA